MVARPLSLLPMIDGLQRDLAGRCCRSNEQGLHACIDVLIGQSFLQAFVRFQITAGLDRSSGSLLNGDSRR